MDNISKRTPSTHIPDGQGGWRPAWNLSSKPYEVTNLVTKRQLSSAITSINDMIREGIYRKEQQNGA